MKLQRSREAYQVIRGTRAMTWLWPLASLYFVWQAYSQFLQARGWLSLLWSGLILVSNLSWVTLLIRSHRFHRSLKDKGYEWISLEDSDAIRAFYSGKGEEFPHRADVECLPGYVEGDGYALINLVERIRETRDDPTTNSRPNGPR